MSIQRFGYRGIDYSEYSGCTLIDPAPYRSIHPLLFHNFQKILKESWNDNGSPTVSEINTFSIDYARGLGSFDKDINYIIF